ncbi:polysaccharide biosynthesis/export family protein [Thalassoroseus pseudoceratinae]|uniref:polysaccharide biosynthesis/export family protein n=1 Tax=Thalassoroseus pseudoceratinae TaxID=2713176 RepID=UPI00141F8F8E|nr:polysaccharide biosynthesis/export family protein [Thalassoroseus pseudoceratinae]
MSCPPRSLLCMAVLAQAALFALSGCSQPRLQGEALAIAHSDVPRELQKTSLPEYRIEPPDILLIEAVHNVRTPETPLRTGDIIKVSLGNPEPLDLPEQGGNPIEQQFKAQLEAQFKFVDGEFLIQPDGTIELGPIYGKVKVAGMSLQQAKVAITNHLKTYTKNAMGQPVGIRDPLVAVTLPNPQGPQAITGPHLVRPDGTVSLGIYGNVHVAGRTLDEAKYIIETQLSQYIEDPRINVDVTTYNSKVIYVITDGGGFGEQVVRLPVTGNETVLDAIAQIQGLSQVSSKRMWVARPAPSPEGDQCAHVMDVNWREITREGITTTNYQLFPGDRVYIQADSLIATDNALSKLFAPIERVLGITLLTNSTIRNLEGQGNGFGNNVGF